MTGLRKERDEDFAARVVRELLAVALVLLDRPHPDLGKGDDEEEKGCNNNESD